MPGWMKWVVALLVGVGIIVLGFRFAGWLLTGFFIINCLVLIIVVLLQSGKAADLAGAFGGAGSQTAFGPRGAANVLSKATTWCAVMFMLCAMALVLRTDRGVIQGGSVLQKVSQPAKPAPAPAPKSPATTPGSTTPGSTPASGGTSPISQPPPQVPPASQKTPAHQPSPTPAPNKQP
jgi:preprotein translocase subunit SecG